jgi:uncharacterized protein YuzE
MKVSYDKSIDAAYIYLVEVIGPGDVSKTYPCDPLETGAEINLDFDRAGRLLGIEVLDASRALPHQVLKLAEAK